VSGGATAIYAVLGWPARGSLSPAMHAAAFAALGLDAAYVACEVPPERLARAVSGAAALGLRGVNLTLPHKVTAVPLCQQLSREARRVGAVNTLSFEAGTVVGHNTDAPGLLRALASAGCDPRGACALVLGAGGMARAALAALVDAGAGGVAIAARAPTRADALREQLGGGRGCIVPWTEAAIARELDRADLVVSCLPPEASPPGLSALRSTTVVLDVSYRTPTALLRAAAQVGARAADGLELLVQQGALALELWTGRPAPVAEMRAAACAARQQAAPATAP